ATRGSCSGASLASSARYSAAPARGTQSRAVGTRPAAAAIAVAIALYAGCGEREPVPAPSPERSAEPTPAGSAVDPRCLALCEHGATCLAARGEPLGADERDCATSCRDGFYAAMPEAALACSAHADCAALQDCTGAALETLLEGRPSLPPPPSAPALPSWPEGFPSIPGGTPLPTTPGDPLTLARVAYPGAPEGVESLLRAELGRAGWEVDPSTADDGAVRFFARQADTEIGVAIYRDAP